MDELTLLRNTRSETEPPESTLHRGRAALLAAARPEDASTGVLVAPKIGAASMIALVIAGQLCVALMLDHFALIGLPGREVGALRIVGAGLLVAGALLITRN